ncbi:MAG: ATP-binding protein [Bacteroidales bacterium]|nr:ATP-binding protein [Bacteroidales bacterium]
MKQVIARTAEVETLERKYRSQQSEFVIVYGRRRIGKTYLVNQVFADRFTFTYVGARKQKQEKQLQRFAAQLKEYSHSAFAPQLQSWEDAFDQLRSLIEQRPKEERKVIFIDEMPWIDTPRSSFVEALEYFWNAWAAQRSDILFIACGSASSWMVNKLIRNRGGLHNRITEQIYLRPFRLNECEQYLHHCGCQWDRYTILQCYMAMGGVPYYMNLLNPSQSLAQNIDRLYFAKNAPMREEFDELFNALFNQADKYIAAINALASNRQGLLRAEIASKTGMSGGSLTKILENLERCDFIETYARYKSSVRNSIYRISDPYTLFYFKFLHNRNTKDEHWWTNNMASHSVEAWQGFSFESICMTHLAQIKHKLGISGMSTSTSTWQKLGNEAERGAQIDLIIERADRVIDLCEMKFANAPYVITKDYEMLLRSRMVSFKEETKTTKSLANILITTYGVQANIHSGIVQGEVLMDDLFVQA